MSEIQSQALASKTIDNLLGTLSEVEANLCLAAASGNAFKISHARPQEQSDDNAIRAELIRILALGGCKNLVVHEKGIQISGAWIKGRIDLQGVKTAGGVLLKNCHFEEQPLLVDSTVSGSLILSGSLVPGLIADRLLVAGTIFLDKNFVSSDEIHLVNARVSGNLLCSGKFDREKGHAIIADQISVGGSAMFGRNLTTRGGISLMGGKIHGTVDFSGGQFQNDTRPALAASGIEVGGGVVMNDGFRSTGAVLFFGAKISGDVDCRYGHFCFPNHHALGLDGSNVNGSVFLGSGFRAIGEVRLVGVRIGGDLDCSSGHFCNPMHNALVADKIDVSGDVLFNNEFKACGTFSIVGANITGGIIFDGEFIEARPTPISGEALSINAERLTVSTLLINSDFNASNIVNLLGGRCVRLANRNTRSPGRIIADGFVYDWLQKSASDVGLDEIIWFDRPSTRPTGTQGESDFRPQPWLHLRNVLRNTGYYEDARNVGIEFEERRRRAGRGSRFSQFFHGLYGILIGYGYRPGRLIVWLVAVWLLCSLGFSFAARYGDIFVPAKSAIYEKYNGLCGSPRLVRWTACKAIENDYTQFYPIAYSLNVLLPVGDLGQEKAWRPTTTTWLGMFTQLAVWFETLFGWVASLVLVAVVSGLSKRDE